MSETPWSAPVAVGPVRGELRVPGSKSMTNRALVLAALADAPSRITGALVARDTSLMADALSSLGTVIEPDGTAVVVSPERLMGPATIDCGLAGTVMRFVPAVAALAEGPVDFTGDAHASKRPMLALLDALRALGVDVAGDALPFQVSGTGRVRGGEVTLDASASSQFVSALLLVGARFDEGLTVTHSGGRLPSIPHIDMTVDMLQRSGVKVSVDRERQSWHVRPGPIVGRTIAVEPDLSNATPFIAAAMATHGAITIADWPRETTQAGDEFRRIAEAMGAKVHWNKTGLTVEGPERLQAIDVDLSDVGELTPTIAALCLLAEGRSTLRGIGHLRGHETDRLAAIHNEAHRMGGTVHQTQDGLEIIGLAGQDLHGATLESYADHRMATFGAILGLKVPDVSVTNIATTDKTLPGFADLWRSLVEAAA